MSTSGPKRTSLVAWGGASVAHNHTQLRPSAWQQLPPTKYQLVINLKTAKAMGFTFPPAVHARANEVIE